jgi:hypothetical protein
MRLSEGNKRRGIMLKPVNHMDILEVPSDIPVFVISLKYATNSDK